MTFPNTHLRDRCSLFQLRTGRGTVALLIHDLADLRGLFADMGQRVLGRALGSILTIRARGVAPPLRPNGSRQAGLQAMASRGRARPVGVEDGRKTASGSSRAVGGLTKNGDRPCGEKVETRRHGVIKALNEQSMSRRMAGEEVTSTRIWLSCLGGRRTIFLSTSAR